MQRKGTSLCTLLSAFLFAVSCGRAPNDAALSTQIKAQMFSDSALQGSSLQVTVDKGEVTLAGTVPTDSARLEAYKIATQTAGVNKVNDEMTIQQAQTEVAAAPPPEPAASEPAPTPALKPEPKKRAKKSNPADAPPLSKLASNDQSQPPQEEPAPPPPPAPEAAPQPAAPPPPPMPPPPPPPPEPKHVQVQAGTTISIRMIDPVDSSVNQPGEIFHASLDTPLQVNNEVIVPRNADVYVRLVQSSSQGKLRGKAELHLELVKMDFQGRSYPLNSSTYSVSGASKGTATAEKVGAGAAIGAVLGAVIGGGKGAAIGAGLGGGGGAVYSGATRGKKVRIPSETKLDFQLEAPVDITYVPHQPLAANNNK